MENFIVWLFDSFSNVIAVLTNKTIGVINMIIDSNGEELESLMNFDINLLLFSETPILSLNAYDLFLVFFSIFYTVIFIICAWKIIKKVVVKITRWNKW